MKRWGIALSAGLLLAVASQSRAQTPISVPATTPSGIPTGGNGLTYVPVNTSNLSTPLPYTIVQQQPTFRDHVHRFFGRFTPSFLQARAPLAGPLSPTVTLPTQPLLNNGVLAPSINVPVVPQISPNIH
jgi:hypothetical protein